MGSLEVKENFSFTKNKISFIIKLHLNIKYHQKSLEIDAVITCKGYFPSAKEVCNRALNYQPAQARGTPEARFFHFGPRPTWIQ